MIARRILILLLWSAGVATAAIPLDVVFPRGNEPLIGRVRDVELLFLVVAVEGREEPARVELAEIEWVDFGEAQLMDGFLRKAASVAVTELEKYWEQRRSLLELPGSTGGAIGLCLVQRYLEEDSLTAAARALEVADLLVEKDWNPATKQEARVLRVGALLGLGRVLEAASALEPLIDPGAGARLRSMLALLQGELEKQNGNPEAAFEHYLKPYVFGGPSELAVAGLEKARALARALPEGETRFNAIEAILPGLTAEAKEDE